MGILYNDAKNIQLTYVMVIICQFVFGFLLNRRKNISIKRVWFFFLYYGRLYHVLLCSSTSLLESYLKDFLSVILIFTRFKCVFALFNEEWSLYFTINTIRSSFAGSARHHLLSTKLLNHIFLKWVSFSEDNNTC